MPVSAVEGRFPGFPDRRGPGYVEAEPDGGGEGVRRDGRITEAGLRRACATGARVEQVVLVEQPVTGNFLVYFRLSDSDRWERLETRRFDGAKDYRDIRPVRQRVLLELLDPPYRGVVCCYMADDPALDALGIPRT